MESFKAIIDAIGVKPLAQAFGLREEHIRMMRSRDSIPVEYWAQVIGIVPPEHGVSLEQLYQLRERRFPPAPRRSIAEAHA